MSTLDGGTATRRKISGQKRADLQGMRAVAVLAVFADHLFTWPPGGFVGVDVFFVLSGFFITGLLIRERTTRRKLSFQNFYVRRVKRILPSAVLVLAVTVAGANLLFPALRAKETLVDALYAAVFAANVRFQAVGADYFQQDVPLSPIQHYWSLSIEEQFYFVWPAVLVAIYALTRRLRRRGNARQWVLFAAMCLVVAASFGWAMYRSANDPNAAYFSTFTRVWELGVGALMAIAAPWLTRMPRAIRPVLAYLGVAGVAASLFVIDSTVQFPAPWAALPVVSTAVVIGSFQGGEVRGVFPLTNPVARWFGDTSYTLYLWHWPVITLLYAVLPKGVVFDVVAITVALGLTAVTYHFFENPIRHSDWLLDKPAPKSRRRPTLKRSGWGLIGGVAAAMVVTSILVIQYNSKISTVAEDDPVVVDLAAPKPDPCFGAAAMTTQGCVIYNPDKPLTPTIDRFAADTQGGYECFREQSEKLKSCTYGYKGAGATRIALVGDSHAAMLIPALSPYLIANKWELTAYTGWGCEWQSPAEDDCIGPMSEIETQLLANPYNLVLTTASRKHGATDAYRKAWEPVAAAGSRIVVVADTPAVSEDSLACVTRVRIGGGGIDECGTSTKDAFARPDPLITAAELVPAATLIDLTRWYCQADRCPSIIGNVIVYKDTGGHLTATYAKTLGRVIADGLRRALST